MSTKEVWQNLPSILTLPCDLRNNTMQMKAMQGVNIHGNKDNEGVTRLQTPVTKSSTTEQKKFKASQPRHDGRVTDKLFLPQHSTNTSATPSPKNS